MSLYVPAATFALDIQRAIEGDPTEVAFTKPRIVQADGTVIPETTLGAQTVRVTSDSRASVVGGTAGDAPRHALVVFGVRDHPQQDDSDIDEGYTFEYGGEIYRVSRVIPVPGGVQAIATTGS